ncbi:DUF3592 domain-containing protein [Streptomyces sp. SBT349]|uniref:DUF3592 domain-containing protein n=1 Tax=Streptomyces sp. SBT349 TaxID=1580539 RepID=UPI00066A7D95|nr:DUF3592 domain-containing protein [Streptomyces sp. SBT349]
METVLLLGPLLFGGWVILRGRRRLRRAARLRSAGISVPGSVECLERYTPPRGGELFRPVVSWSTADGTRMRQTSAVGRRQADLGPVRRGAEVTVRYDPAEPAVMWTEGWDVISRGDDRWSWAAVFFGVFVCVSAAVQMVVTAV